MKISLFAAAAMSVLSLAATAHAEVVAGYDFTGYTGNESAGTVTTADDNVIVTNATRGSGFNEPGVSDTRDMNSVGVYPTNTNVYYDTVADNTSAGQYLAFTMDPDDGYSLSLTQVVFAGDIQNGQSTGSPVSLGLSYSTDGTDYTTVTGTITGGNGSQGNAMIGTFPLSITDDTSPVYFRLFLLGNGLSDSGTAGNPYEIAGFGQHATSGTTEAYDIEADGTVQSATPEPASLGILCVGALGLIRRRRR